ncbi:MAG: redoxin domain-containing protein [Bacteroidales bacterium]|nr:redoxin domain-containing protein [Bacteroidales bacterium]
MRSFSLAAAALAAAALLSCSHAARVEGVVADAPDTTLTLRLLDVNRLQLLDTLRTDSEGRFSARVDVPEESAEFIYLYYGERQLASLILEPGDRVKVTTDTLGAYRVEGSPESQQLQVVESDYRNFLRDMGRGSDADRARRYIQYYRDRVSYVLTHSRSLTVVPVLYQRVNGMPLFSQETDGLLIRNVCDSLRLAYPASRYIKALDKEATRRINYMSLNARLRSAGETGYIDIELPGLDGQPCKLSEVEAPVTLIYFWSGSAREKLMNLDSLLPLYEEFHHKGFEIYSVALDPDKTLWATTMRNQQLPWVNVCDSRGASSPYIGAYGITSLPMAWLLRNGEIDPGVKASSPEELAAYLRSSLK